VYLLVDMQVPWPTVIYSLFINFVMIVLLTRTTFGLELFMELARDVLRFAANYVPAAIATFELSGFLAHLIYVSVSRTQ
jgi:hypothetical protein